jgi:hypothetical protein
MAHAALKTLLAYLSNGAEPGESLNEFRKRLAPLVDQAIESVDKDCFVLGSIVLANGESFVSNWSAHKDIKITAIYGIKSTGTADEATATMTAGGNNPLSGTNIDLDALTDDTPTSQTLSATAANLLMSTGDLFKCTFAAGGGSGALAGGAVVVAYEPQ